MLVILWLDSVQTDKEQVHVPSVWLASFNYNIILRPVNSPMQYQYTGALLTSLEHRPSITCLFVCKTYITKCWKIHMISANVKITLVNILLLLAL